MRMKIVTWEQKQIQMASCTTYEELESIVQRINIDHHFEIPDNIRHAKTSFEIDYTAQNFYPQDAPQDLIPCKCYGDGNCFMRAVSHVLFGTEDYYLALCAVTEYEAITHKNFYLDNVYLKYGRSHDNNLKAQFAIYSGLYNNVITNTWNNNTIEMIHEAEVLEIAKDTKYCGMWQFYQVSNIVCWPIRSVYPVGFVAPVYRLDLNRIAYPI